MKSRFGLTRGKLALGLEEMLLSLKNAVLEKEPFGSKEMLVFKLSWPEDN